MGINFRLPDGTCVDVDFSGRNMNLLGHAQAVELEVGSRCGGHGVCGGDRIRIAEKHRALLSPPTDDERRHLSEPEIRDGFRLACQCYPERSSSEIDVTISIPE